MADPKYADLPGIAHDEPDVYETNDLPESDQTSDFYEEENDAIERIHLSAGEAFSKFKGKALEGGKVDFSERIGKRVRTGYDARSGDWELAGRGDQETVLQKYQRLQCEMKELFEEVKGLKEGGEAKGDCLVSKEQVEESLKKLNELRLEETLGADLVASISDPEGAQLKKLVALIEQLKSTAADQPESESGTDNDGIVYQFNYKPELARLQQTARVAELESRLHRLEAVLGATDDKLARLASGNKKESLLETAEHLSATASLLDSAQLDHIEGRLSALLQNLDTVREKKEKLTDDPEKDKMVNELYDLVKNTENMRKVLPQTIERLTALEALHKKATEFTTTLAQVETLQTDVSNNVHNNKALLQGVQESFAMNLDEINKTIISLDARIKALKK